MFGLAKATSQVDEARQPSFIKSAQIFQTQETKDNIDQLEREAKEMIQNFSDKPQKNEAVNRDTFY